MPLIPVSALSGGGSGIAQPVDPTYPDSTIVYTLDQNGLSPVEWNGATEGGVLYFRLLEDHPNIARVQWFKNLTSLDGLPDQANEEGFPGFVRGDINFPYTPTGGLEFPFPFDTTLEPNGPLRWTARITYDDGFVRVFDATGTVDNETDVPQVPGAPVLVGVSAPAPGQARPVWQQPANSPTSYDIQHDSSASFPSPESIFLASPVLSFTVTGLAAGTYWFRVRGRNSAGPGDWSNALSVVVTAGSGYGEGYATGVTSGGGWSRGSTQAKLFRNSTTAMPAQIGMTNVDRRVSMATNAAKRNGMKKLDETALARWNAGYRPASTSFDGPQALLFCTIGWGVNAKRPNNNVSSLHRLAETWNGELDAAWIEVVDYWLNSTLGGYNDWPHRFTIRFGQELGPFFPDFPGIDNDDAVTNDLPGRVGNTSMYPSEIKAAMDQVNIDGDRFPVWKGAWDHIVGLVRSRCLAAGKTPALFLANFVHGDADPGDSGPNGPTAQYVPECATDVDETPDILGLDVYGRGAALRPNLVGAPNGDPDNYDFEELHAVLTQHGNLALTVNRPVSYPEWWSNRKRDASAGGLAWNDHERAAFTRYMFEWIDTGGLGMGLAIHSHSMFHQPDATPPAPGKQPSENWNRQTARNYSYTFDNDTLPYTVDHLGNPAPTPAAGPLMREAMAELFPANEIDLE